MRTLRKRPSDLAPTVLLATLCLLLVIGASAPDVAAQRPLASGVCVDSTNVPTHYRFTQTGVPYWAVVGVAPQPGDDKDIYVYTGPNATGSLLAYSTATSGSDFVVADFNHTSFGTYYPTVTYGTTWTPYMVEWKAGGKILPLNHALNVQIWGIGNECYAFDVWDVYLEAGATYRFMIHHADFTVRLALFRNPGTGAYWAGRDQSVFQISGVETDGDYVAPASDWYGLVVGPVYRQPVNSAWAGIEVRKLNTCAPLASRACVSAVPYSVSTGPVDSYSFQQTPNWWSAVAVAPSAGDQKNLRLRAQCDYNAGNAGYLAESVPPVGETALIVGDFNHVSPLPVTRFVNVDGGNPNAEYTIEWEDGADIFPVNSQLSGVIGGTTGNCNLVEIWDIVLEAGKTYRLVSAEQGLAGPQFALFKNPGDSPYYADRNNAFWLIAGSGYITATPTYTTDYFGLAVFANKRGESGSYTVAFEAMNDCDNIPTGSCVTSQGNVKDFFMGAMQNDYWIAVGVLPSDGDDKDISVYSSCDGGEPLQGFSNGTQGTDFVVADCNHPPASLASGSLEPLANNWYPRVTYGSTAASYTVSSDLGNDISQDLFPHNVVVSGAVGGVSGACGMLKIWDLYLVQGTQYHIGFTQGGGADVRLALFRNPTNYRLWAGRSARQWELSGSQNFEYTAPATDYYGFIVFANRRDKLGNYTIRVSSGITGIDPEPTMPDQYALYQNTPNPFNPTTEIRYDVPSRGGSGGSVSLRIYDVNGRLVRTLFEGEESGGQKTITWDARDDGGTPVATGVYFYRLEAPGFSQTRKTVMMK
jgi:hypothetical protein